mgnify:FL=1
MLFLFLGKYCSCKSPAGHQLFHFLNPGIEEEAGEARRYATKFTSVMLYSENFEQWKTAIEALPLEEVKLPNQPIDDFVGC